jgi:hypothetical protein
MLYGEIHYVELVCGQFPRPTRMKRFKDSGYDGAKGHALPGIYTPKIEKSSAFGRTTQCAINGLRVQLQQIWDDQSGISTGSKMRTVLKGWQIFGRV